jgi:ATP-dependent 26S proteasome regulatory subunit
MPKKSSFESEASNSDFQGEETEIKDKNEIKEEEQNDISNLDLIKSISQTLSSIVENSKKQNNYKEILKKQSKMVFSANLIPNISIQDYLIRIQTYSKIEKSTLIISLILIDRICQRANLTLTYYNIHRILFSSILISIKFNEDNYYDNKFYADIAGVKTKELKMLEYTFLSMLHFNLFIKNDLYEKYKDYLEEFDSIEK